MSPLSLLIGTIAATFLVITIVPDPYAMWTLNALLAALVLASAIRAVRASRSATEATVIHRLERTSHQRIALAFAAFFVVMLAWSVFDDARSAGPPDLDLYVLVLLMILTQLVTAIPSGLITEAGIFIHGTLYRWAVLREPRWAQGEAATLEFTIERDGKRLPAKWGLAAADRAAVTEALTKYGDYSPIAGS